MSTSTTGTDIKGAGQEEEEEHALYKLLGVPVNATQKQIKKAYHMKARHVHPDRCGGTIEAKTNFQVLQKAYSILSDPEKRKLYDRTGCTDADNEQFWEAYKHYREAFPEITKDDMKLFEKEYRKSTEEQDAVIAFYKKSKGDISHILGFILCSRDDDIPRFIKMIDDAIASGAISIHPAYKTSKKHVLTSEELDKVEGVGEDIANGAEDEDEEEIEELDDDDDDDWIVHDEEEEPVEVEEAAVNLLPAARKKTAKGKRTQARAWATTRWPPYAQRLRTSSRSARKRTTRWPPFGQRSLVEGKNAIRRWWTCWRQNMVVATRRRKTKKKAVAPSATRNPAAARNQNDNGWGCHMLLGPYTE